MHIFQRAQSFVKRIIWLRRFMSNTAHTAVHLILIKFFPNRVGEGNYCGYKFSFLPQDMSAIYEVLVDKEYSFLEPLLNTIKSPVVIDTGTNIGTFSLWLLGKNNQSQILSVEASPKTFETLKKTVHKANERGARWRCIHKAAWKDNEFISFADDGDSMGHKVLKTGLTKVQGITLSELVNEHLEETGAESIDILKVDIEGAEEAFLEDSSATREALNKVDNLVIELHPNYCNIEPVEAFIKSCYQLIEPQVDRVSNKPLLLCSRSSNS